MTKRIQLDKRWIAKLSRFAEAGMGYQRVDVYLSDGQCVKDVIALNSEVLEWPSRHPVQTDDIVDIVIAGNDERGSLPHTT